MIRLFEITNQIRELLDGYETAVNYEPQKNEKGEYIDLDGNVIDEKTAREFKQAMIEAYETSLETIEIEFNEKVESIACYIKELNAEINAIEKQEESFKQRREAKENITERLKNYLKQEMLAINSKKIEGINAKISIRNNAESVKISDEKAYTQWALENNRDLLKFKPEVSKTNIKNAIKEGAEIPYCTLTRTQSLIIK